METLTRERKHIEQVRANIQVCVCANTDTHKQHTQTHNKYTHKHNTHIKRGEKTQTRVKMTRQIFTQIH